MKIYTKAGDSGMTGLIGAGRYAKDAPRIDAYGTVDELNAAIGVARAAGVGPAADTILGRIQNDLFLVGSALADPDPAGPFHSSVGPERAEALELAIDAMEARLEPLRQFILPGGSTAAASLHLARTICRRAERMVVRLGRSEGESVSDAVLIYLNRLSDLLFVLARDVNRADGFADIPWAH